MVYLRLENCFISLLVFFFFFFFILGALAKVSSATPGWHSLTGCPRDALTHRESGEIVGENETIDANATQRGPEARS
jgi:hypothetical protein